MRMFAFVLAAAATMPVAAQRISSTSTLPANQEVRLLRAATDIDGDGAADLVAVVKDTSYVSYGVYLVLAVSGVDGSALRTFGPPASLEPQDVVGFGDADGDGHGDVAVATIGAGGVGELVVYSGVDGVVLYTQPNAYLALCAIGDRDGNGRDDLGAAAWDAAGIVPVLVRGESGVPFGSLPPVPSTSSKTRVRSVGDVTGEGHEDLVIGQAYGPTYVVDSDSGVVVYEFNPAGSTTFDGERAVETIDLDQDGMREVLVLRGENPVNRIEVYGGESGLLRFAVTAPPMPFTVPASSAGDLGKTVCAVGDLNADGFVDFAASVDSSFAPITGRVYAFSGRDGGLLWTFAGDPYSTIGVHLAATADVDGDGRGDLACSFTDWEYGTTSGDGWHLIASGVVAEATDMGGACGGSTLLPRIAMTRPVIGQQTTVMGVDGPSAPVPGVLAFSLQPVMPSYLGVGACFAWFDVGAAMPLWVTPATVPWSVVVPLPNAPGLAGLPVALQCVWAPTGGPLGLDVSNGLWARLGWQ